MSISAGYVVLRLPEKNYGDWVWLGSYAMDPVNNPEVALSGSNDGPVAADAIRFVSGDAVGGDVVYTHSDQLGTIQKLTDASGSLAWDRIARPFGETVSISAAGGVTQMQRFPGQYADETGLSYNYFRDYDPTIGRYMESDPIGLGGGINTYGYVGGNPNIWTDRKGLRSPAGDWPGDRKSTVCQCNNISVFQEDFEFDWKTGRAGDYGHWWIQLGQDSYGWWPASEDPGFADPGSINGGRGDQDPHHGDSDVDNMFNPHLDNFFGTEMDCRAQCQAAAQCIRNYARNFHQEFWGPWWIFGINDCHDFVEDALSTCNLRSPFL